MRYPRLLLSLATAAALAAAAPAGAARKDMEILQSDVDELQRQVYDLKRLVEQQSAEFQRVLTLLEASPEARAERAALTANLDTLLQEVRTLGTRFDDAAARLGEVEQRMSQCCARGADPAPAAGTDGPTSPAASGPGEGGAAAGAPPPPTGPGDAVFQQAYGDYLKGNFELAVAEFRDYLQRNPQGDLADDAQYWIGMSFFNQRKYEEAVRELDLVLSHWPESSQAPAAGYRKGVALLELNRLGQAVLTLNEVQTRYPDSEAARQAAERLEEVAHGRQP